MLGIHIGKDKTQAEYTALKANFDNIFINDVKVNSENVNVDKIDFSQDIVYNGYPYTNDDENYYHIDINLPILNIKNDDVVKKINADIKEKFYDKATNDIMRRRTGFTNYQVNYMAYVNDGAISIVIKEVEKSQNKAEAVKISTYNYSIPDKKEIGLKDLIKLKGITEESVQNTINSTIKVAADNALEISKQYGATFTRDLNDSMYKIENIKDYFLTDDRICLYHI